MAFGVYVHIPYCLQRCPYCDFSTYVWDEIMPPEKYIEILRQEIRLRTHALPNTKLDTMLDTIYFGGGTPSLIEAKLIISVIEELEKCGLNKKDNCEVTIEINPATVDRDKLHELIENGVNRFSVGAQTFDDGLLKKCGRKHNAQDTIDTLNLLNHHQLNFSLDVLFALPGQSITQLELDLETALSFQPKHVSPYCLTLQENHPMQVGRPPEEEQIEMFELIDRKLREKNIQRYEISNYSQPGYESRHNLLYWTDENFLSFGNSAHSYLNRDFSEKLIKEAGYELEQKQSPLGYRFWNAASIKAYEQQILSLEPSDRFFPTSHFPADQIERISENQALTDFCHTSLRLSRGLDFRQLKQKFSARCVEAAEKVLSSLAAGPLIELENHSYRLTSQGVLTSNLVFEKLTFLPADIH